MIMDFLSAELESMASNVTSYSVTECGSEIPLEHITGSTSLTPSTRTNTAMTPSRKGPAEYLIKLRALLETPDQVKEMAGLSTAPALLKGTGEDGEASFVRVSEASVDKIKLHLARSIPKRSWPTFIRLSQAPKALSPDSPCPTLGLDTTLPQNRPSHSQKILYHPLQDEYPVWYFFYGTLADTDRLTELMDLSAKPVLTPAKINGGTLKVWAGRYKALVDGSEIVEGWAYQVQTKDHEDALRVYETENYEVVRCEIHIEDDRVWGCTFRFIDKSALD